MKEKKPKMTVVQAGGKMMKVFNNPLPGETMEQIIVRALLGLRKPDEKN